MPLQVRLKPVESLLFRSDVAAVGSFRCPASHPMFRDSGPCTHHTFVFPRTATEIRHDRGTWFVASPNTVVFYNQNQAYARRDLSGIDESDWYVVADDVLAEALAVHDPRGGIRSEPFRLTHTAADAATYLKQRALFDRLTSGRRFVDAFEVDEAVLGILDAALRSAFGTTPRQRPSRDRVEAVKAMLASSPAAHTSLRTLANAVDTSPSHLCRAFRAATGMSITRYRHSLRLRSALALLAEPGAEVTAIALSNGFSSHSHFTSLFRRHFGITPSQYRSKS